MVHKKLTTSCILLGCLQKTKIISNVFLVSIYYAAELYMIADLDWLRSMEILACGLGLFLVTLRNQYTRQQKGCLPEKQSLLILPGLDSSHLIIL